MAESRSVPHGPPWRPSQPVLAFRAECVPDVGAGRWWCAWTQWRDAPLEMPRPDDPIERGQDFRRFQRQPERNFLARLATVPEVREAQLRGLEIRLPADRWWWVVSRRGSLNALIVHDDCGDHRWGEAMCTALWLMACGDCRGPHIVSDI